MQTLKSELYNVKSEVRFHSGVTEGTRNFASAMQS